MPYVKIYVYDTFQYESSLTELILQAIETCDIPRKYATIEFQRVPKAQWAETIEQVKGTGGQPP